MIEPKVETLPNEQILLHLQALFLLSIIILGVGWVACRKKFFQLPPTSEAFPPVIFFHVLTAFIIYIFVQVSISSLGSIYSKYSELSSQQELINVIAITLSTVALVIYSLFVGKSCRRYIWGQKPIDNLMIGCMTWFLSFPIVVAIGQIVSIIMLLFLPEVVEIDQVAVKFLKSTRENPIVFIITSLSIISIVPIGEELLFRGFLQSWLKNYLGRISAIITTSLIFTLFHFSPSQGVSNVQLLTSLFVLSCFLGFIYERQRSLWASIGLHAFFNMISVIMILVSKE